MLPIIWRAEAREDLRQIVAFIAQDNPPAARRLLKRLQDAVLPLAEHPYLFRPSERVAGLREVVAHPNYVVLYRVTSSCIEVAAVVHTRRQYPGVD